MEKNSTYTLAGHHFWHRKCYLIIILTLLSSLPSVLQAANTDGDLRIEILTGPNLVVHQNIENSGDYSPSSFYISAQVCNDGSNPLTNVEVSIGDFSNGIVGIYPIESVDELALGYPYYGEFSLIHEGSLKDAVRFIDAIPANTCVTLYWLVNYPRFDEDRSKVTGNNLDLSDDLRMQYDVWAKATDGAAKLAAETYNYVSCRNELTNASNKVWPENTNKVPTEYINIVEDSLGWTTDYSAGDSTVCPAVDNLLLKGIWYDLGEVDQGYDNDGDLIPDFNAWLQPIGDPDQFDPNCYRLVKSYGMLFVDLKAGGTHVVQFSDQLYFTDIPANNGVLGFVVYEFVILNGPCSAVMTPYQEVASGSDNETFNTDFGVGTAMISSESLEDCINFTNNADVSKINSLPAALTYTLTAENLSNDPIGQNEYHHGLVIRESIPSSTEYVSGSANVGNTLPAGLSGYTIRYSKDDGKTWSETEPTPLNEITDIQWWFDDQLPALATAAVTFQVTVPVSYTAELVPNSGYLSVGFAPSLAEDTAMVQIIGLNAICGNVWADNGGSTGASWNERQDGDESDLANITVYLYKDVNINGDDDDEGGITGGHFDVDTYTQIGAFNNSWVDGHAHKYDDNFNVVGIDCFNFLDPVWTYQLHEIDRDISDVNQKFKLLVSNADLSPGGRLVINDSYFEWDPNTYTRVREYDNIPIENLPIYSLSGTSGTTQLTDLGIYLKPDAIGDNNLLPTNYYDVVTNTPGLHGEWRNGALLVQAVAVNSDGTDAFTTEESYSAGGRHGVATSGLLWEVMIYWHWDGRAYHLNPDYVPNIAADDAIGSSGFDADYLWATVETDANGNYCFTNLPDGNYVVAVDNYDPDLQAGYIETNDTYFPIDLDASGQQSSGLTLLENNFGFGPPLLVNKTLTSDNPAYEGDTLSFSINISNRSELSLALVPLADTFNADRLEFLYAVPEPTTVTTGLSGTFANTGLLEWDNTGGIGGTEPILYSSSLPRPDNLIGYWTFNEGTGSIASDYSGKGNHGTLQSSPTWVTGKYGNALDFDNSYVEVPYHADFDSRKVTVAAWVNFDVAGDYNGIVTKGTTTSAFSLEMAWPVVNGNVNDDNFRFANNLGLGNYSYTESNTEVFPGEWHHVAFTTSGRDAIMYLDGEIDGGARLKRIRQNLQALIIGANLPSAAYFDGKIDEVAVYDDALTQEDIKQLMLFNSLQLDLNNIVLHYDLEEGTSTTIIDQSGKGITGSAINNPSWALGQVGTYALDFDGTDDYVISNNVTQGLDNSFSMSFWVNTSNPGTQYLISQDRAASDTTGEWWITTNASGYIDFAWRDGGSINNFAATSGALNDGNWHHIFVNYTGSDLRLYRDGTQISNFTTSINLPVITAPVWLAKDTRADTDYYDGLMDHIYIFDDSMSTAKISELYNAFYPSFAPFGGDCPQLIGNWDFEEGFGTSTRDESGFGYTGTLKNSPDWILGQSGRYALDFSGNSLEHVDYGISDLNLGSSFSIAFWLKSDGSDNIETVFAKGTPGTAGHFQAYLNNGELYFRTDVPVSIDQSSGYVFDDDIWHHAVINYNGGAFIFYVDGQSVSSASQTFTIPALDAQFMVGRRTDVTANEFNSQLDQLLIYNCALSQEQIARLLSLGTIEELLRQEINVFFKAKDPAGVSVGTTNSVCVSGAMFTDGRAANQGCDVDLANVVILNTGEISGTVWSDIDGDGWQGTVGYENGEAGIPGVRVVLESCPSVSGGVCSGTITRDTISTDINGYYEFEGLYQNTFYRNYIITTDIPDSTPSQTGDPDDDPNRGSGDGNLCGTCDDLWDNGGAWFEMLIDTWGTENEVITDINFGYQIAGSIFGVVWDDVDGDGLRASNEPFISGVTVNLTGGATAITDDNGIYTFSDVTPGTYTVSVDLASLAGGPWTATGESDNTVDNAISVTLTTGQVAGSHEFGFLAQGFAYIGDEVYYDWDADGIRDLNEEGISGVNVNLYRDANENGIKDIFDIYLSTAVTDQDGIYIFDFLPEGNYMVGIDESDPNFPQSMQTGDPDEDGACTTCDSWGAAWIDGFFPNEDVDFGYRPLGSASIGDFVWFDKNGDGQQDGLIETGLSYVGVTLYVDLNRDGIYDTVRTSQTDFIGAYSFDDLPDGDFEIVVDSLDNALPTDPVGNPYSLTTASRYLFSIDGGVITEINGTSCTVCNLDLDFGFTSLSLIGDRVFWDANANGTQDLNEFGVGDVTVYLCNGNVNCNSSNAIRTTTTSDGTDGKAVGYYQFAGLPEGDYTVSVETASGPLSSSVQTADPNSDGLACDDPDRVALGYPNCDNKYSRILIPGTFYTGADFGYQPSGVVGDKVWFDQNGDGNQDNDEQGIAGLTVYLCPGTGPCTAASATDTVTTDYDGLYSFYEVVDGAYSLTVIPPAGYTPTTGAESVGSSNIDIVISGGSITSIGGTACASCDLDVDFGYEIVGSFSLSGTVCLDDGSEDGVCTGLSGELAQDDVIIYLYNDEGLLIANTTTDANGDYSFGNLIADDYQVVLNRTLAPLDIADLTTTNADVPSGGTIALSGPNVYQSIPLTNNISDADFAFVVNVDFDFGDLPDPYRTTNDANPLAAYHQIPSVTTLYLGSTVDSETDGQRSGDAYGDDSAGSDDEDGVTFINEFGWSVGSTDIGNGGIVDVIVTGSGWLAAWMDFNQDGDFGDVGEMMISQAVNTGTVRYNFDIPNGTTLTGEYFSRFRLFESEPIVPLASSAGYANNGEVEDYVISLQPLPVEVLEFKGEWQDKNARLYWTAAPNEAAIEYQLERSLNQQDFKRIHSVAATAGDEIQTYEHLDLSVMDLGQPQYYYRIKQIDDGGTAQYSQIVELSATDIPYLALNIYPNPVKDMMNIEYTMMKLQGDKLRIVNSLGQEIWQRNFEVGAPSKGNIQVNTSQWAEGFYYLELTHDQGSEVWKFIVR
ncbi:MAG: SdrD B-like domain-containing protein [Bacteroidia bacterium]